MVFSPELWGCLEKLWRYRKKLLVPCGLNGDGAAEGRVGPLDPRTAGPNTRVFLLFTDRILRR